MLIVIFSNYYGGEQGISFSLASAIRCERDTPLAALGNIWGAGCGGCHTERVREALFERMGRPRDRRPRDAPARLRAKTVQTPEFRTIMVRSGAESHCYGA